MLNSYFMINFTFQLFGNRVFGEATPVPRPTAISSLLELATAALLKAPSTPEGN